MRRARWVQHSQHLVAAVNQLLQSCGARVGHGKAPRSKPAKDERSMLHRRATIQARLATLRLASEQGARSSPTSLIGRQPSVKSSGLLPTLGARLIVSRIRLGSAVETKGL